MVKKGSIRLISPLSVNLKNFCLYFKGKYSSEIYRCRFCFQCRIKKTKNLLYRLSGHNRKCYVINKKDNIAKRMDKINKKNKILVHTRDNILNIHENLYSKNNNNSTDNIIDTEEFPLKENEDFVLIKNFVIFKKKIIGEGGFTKTILGYDKDSEEYLAIKFSKEKKQFSSVLIESAVLEKIKSNKGFPKIKAKFKYNSRDVIIETLLGPNLRNLFEYCGEKFDIRTIFLIAISILNKLEIIHKTGLLHNDLKLSNLAWGIIKNGKVINNKEIFILDFGLATRFKFFKEKKKNNYKDNKDDIIHYDMHDKKSLIGNIKFMSIDVLLGKNPCPKTELESFLYLIIYLIKKKLPWSAIRGKNREDKRNKIIKCHQRITNKVLCNKIPYQIAYIYYNVIELKENEEPKYKYYMKILKEFLFLNQTADDIKFCWENNIISEAEKLDKISDQINFLLNIQNQ